MPASRIVKVEVSRRGPQGAINPADQARIDAAAEIAETITAVVQTATDAQAGAVAAAGQSSAAAEAAQQAASTAATDAAAIAAPAAAAAVQAAVATEADRATTAAASVEATADKLASIDRGDALADGSAVVLRLDDGGDLIRVGPDGLRLVPSQDLADRVLEGRGLKLGPELSDGGRDLMRLDGRALMRLYPDGLDMKLRPASIPAPETVRGTGWAYDRTADSYTAQAGERGISAVDRFRDVDGIRYPAPVIGGVTRKAVIISSYGQSNANVTDLLDPLVWTRPPMPHHTLMLGDVASNGQRGGLEGWQGVAAPGAASLIPATETGTMVQDYATAAFCRLNLMGPQPFRVAAVRSSAWGGNLLVGIAPAQGIWKDSAGAYTQSWLNWRRDINDCHRELTELGYQVDKIILCFTHQEADWNSPRATYTTNFLAMKAEKEAQIAADHPGLPVQWFVDQASGSGMRTPTYNGGAWPVRMAIVDAVAQGGSNITMVMPRYWMSFGRKLDGAQEDIHHSYTARVLQGEVYAHAIHEIEQGRPWRCPWPTGATVEGNSVVITFDSLLPLVIDPTFCKVRPDMGFVVSGGIAVTGVRLTGQRQVTVDCAASPAGQSISYAYRAVDGGDVLDEWPIATGALRDAWQAQSVFLPGQRLVRAALGFQLPL